MTIPDPVQLVIDLLRADPTVAGLTAGRVGREVPAEDVPSMPRACIVVQPAGGAGRRGMLKLRGNRLDTHCYGATLADAWALHLAARETLETYLHDGDLLTVTTLSDGANGRDPSTQWPVCFASYRVVSAA